MADMPNGKRNRDERNKNGAPAFSVNDEIRRNRQLRSTGRRRNAKRRTAPLAAVALCIAICLVLICVIFATVFRVETVTVSGNIRYTDGEILAASEIGTGDLMLFIGRDKLQRKIVSACPHIETVELIKTFPSSLEIRVTETGAVYYTAVRDRICTLDAMLRVIECTDATAGLTELRLPEIRSAIEGSALTFADEGERTFVKAALDVLGEADDALSFDCIDLRDRYNIKAFSDGSAEVLFGDSKDLGIKLQMARRVYTDALAEKSSGTRIDVSEPSRVSVSYDQVINYSKD